MNKNIVLAQSLCKEGKGGELMTFYLKCSRDSSINKKELKEIKKLIDDYYDKIFVHPTNDNNPSLGD